MYIYLLELEWECLFYKYLLQYVNHYNVQPVEEDGRAEEEVPAAVVAAASPRPNMRGFLRRPLWAEVSTNKSSSLRCADAKKAAINNSFALRERDSLKPIGLTIIYNGFFFKIEDKYLL